MKNKLCVILMAALLTILSGCQKPVAEQNVTENPTSYETYETTSANVTTTVEINIDETQTTEFIDVETSDKNSEIITAEHIKCAFESNGKIISIDADVSGENPVNGLYTYTFFPVAKTEESTEKILKAFFGERGDSFILNDLSGVYVLDPDNVTGYYSTASISSNYMVLDTHINDYNPFYENRILELSEMKCTYTEEEAIKLCDDFLKNIGFNDYYLDNVQYFGAVGKNYYYKIIYAISIDGFPTAGKGNYNQLYFYVDNDGLMYAEGNVFNLSGFAKQDCIESGSIMTAKEAVGKLEENIDLISVGYESGSPLPNNLDQNGGINEINIWNIELGYYLVGSEARPCWIFKIGENANNIDTKAFLVVDLIDGAVKT